MNKCYIIIALMFVVYSLSAQSYSINHFQSTYDTLVDYRSVTIELGLAGENPFYWSKNFDFGFEFPFYGESYESFYLGSDAVGYFEGIDDNFNLFLFGGVLYTIDNILDTTYLHSEVRYKYLEINELNALAFEYHNIYNGQEFDDNGANHYMNFQVWFFENGIIEIHFGDIDLENCSYYFPGEGFSFDNSDPEGHIYGPWVTISNHELTEAACIFGDYADPEITYDDYNNCSVLTSIPPIGSVIQFLPSNISSTSEYLNNETKSRFSIAYVNNEIEILGDLKNFESCALFDISGRKIQHSLTNRVSVNPNENRIVLVQIISTYGIETHKLFTGNY